MNDEDLEDIIDTLLMDVKAKDVYKRGQSLAQNILIHMNNNPNLFARQGPVPMMIGLCEAYMNTIFNLIAQASPTYSTDRRDQQVITMAQEMLRTYIKGLEDFRAPEPRERMRSDYRERKATREQK